jgi:hypothetical protein
METHTTDPHAQLRLLYRSLLERQDNFDEFKQLLALYPSSVRDTGVEPEDAAKIRIKLNERIREWIGGAFEELSPVQVLQWRVILVEERFNVSMSPWKESNNY